jgi:hypothetical protein
MDHMCEYEALLSFLEDPIEFGKSCAANGGLNLAKDNLAQVGAAKERKFAFPKA